ncbi:hypothetical protein [Methanobrevibacter sp. V14]|uniref:hypothetical protein n=1 Tax=Methanobrevibacter sp. V14 TaxID=3064280 RepID=UPI002736333B|nr:hypothetical protein [Methanobrevibacter sp. V14]
MNDVYNDNYEEFNDVKSRFKEIIEEDLIFGKSPSFNEEDGAQLRIQTRTIDVQNIAVLPSMFIYDNEVVSAIEFIKNIYNKFNNNGKFTQRGLNKISECMINISYTFFSSNNGQSFSFADYYFNIIDLCYNFEEGLYENDNIFSS